MIYIPVKLTAYYFQEGEDDVTEFEWDVVSSWKGTDTTVQLKYSTDDEEEESITIETKHVSAACSGTMYHFVCVYCPGLDHCFSFLSGFENRSSRAHPWHRHLS